MEVHPPDHPLHTWRDFFVHIATIVIGLLIAIGLEQSVEWVHHRHIVREARDNIHTEIEQNEKAMRGNVDFLGKNLEVVKANIRTLDKLRTHEQQDHMSLEYHMAFDNMSDAAWRTARDTGALAYMPYDEVQQYADVYESQADANAEATTLARQEFSLLGPTQMGIDVTKLPDADYMEMLHGSGTLLIQICAFRQQTQQLDREYLTLLHQNPNSVRIDECSNLMQ